VLSDDSDEGQSNRRSKKRAKKSIDLTAEQDRDPVTSSTSSRKGRQSASELNKELKEKLEKIKKSPPKSPKSLTRRWCSMTVNFSESNSLDPEAVDSSFPSFDVHFVPISKDNVSKWNKPRQDVLRVSQRMSVSEFRKEVAFNRWAKDQKRVPGDIGIFKCEHPATPNKTKIKPFVRVNQLLSEQDRIGVAECGRDYKLYFIPSSAQPSKVLNRVYQPQMGVVQDRMWVIWRRQKAQKSPKSPKEKKQKKTKKKQTQSDATDQNEGDPFAAFADGSGGFSSLIK